MTVAEAHRALTDAEEQVREAERARDRARDTLDQALAGVGWRRLVGAFGQDATRLYTSPLYPDALLTVDDVLAHLDQQRRATA